MSNDPRHPHLSSGYEHTGDQVKQRDTETEAVLAPQGEAPEDLSGLKVAELRALAESRGIDHDGLKKAELVEALGG